jgi:hypothetical protein
MKKILAIAAMSAVASLGVNSAQAGSWDILCVKQGPARGFGMLPKRTIDPTLNSNPGNQLGYPIGARTIPTQMKSAEKSDVVGEMNFFSLGFGGQVVFVYTGANGFFANVPGEADLNIFETTWGDPDCSPNSSEKAKVEVSEDGLSWVTANVCHNGEVEIFPLLKAKYVRITDETNPDPGVQGDGVDAFDVDGIEAKADWFPTTNPLCDYMQGVASQFVGMGMPSGTGIVNQRKNFANAQVNDPTFTGAQLAMPSLREVSGWYNFWSIGFGGYACVQLPRTVFDNLDPAQPEFRMYETTWNNKPCPNYNERVWIQTSPDGNVWSAPRVLCKDGTFDIAGDFPAVNYIKFTDASSTSDFGAGADSYDIDNIFIGESATPGDLCGPGEEGGRRSFFPEVASVEGNGGVPEEMFALQIEGANVVSDKISFLATIAEEGGYNYTIRNHTGQEVANGSFEGNLYETPTVDVATGKFAPGVYFLTLSSATGKETVKFIKK